MSKPVSLKGHQHFCPMVEPGKPPRPHVGGPVVSTQQRYVTVDGIPIATVGDECLCGGVPTTASITSGSGIVKIDGKSAARIGDSTAHGGNLTQGVPWLTME